MRRRQQEWKGVFDSISNLCNACRISQPFICTLHMSESGSEASTAMVKDIHVELRGVDHPNDLKGGLDTELVWCALYISYHEIWVGLSGVCTSTMTPCVP